MLKEFAPYLAPLLIAALILRRAGRAQKVRLRAMWIRPVILLLLLAGALAAGPMPQPLAIAAFVLAAILGTAVGYLMARHRHLTIDPETGEISSRATMFGTMLVLGLFAVRFGARAVLPQLADPGHAGTLMTLAANGLLVFTVAILTAQPVFLWRRTQPLLAAHAAQKLAGGAPGVVPVAEAAEPTE